MGTAKSFLLLNSAVGVYGALQDGGSVTTATTSTGWTVGTTAPVAYAMQVYNAKISSFGSTAQPSTGPANAGDCWRTQNTYSGHFEAGTWTVAMSVISSAAAASGAGKLRFRLWKSSDPTGTGLATELTTSTMATGSWSNLSTATAQNLTATQSISAVDFVGEFLFVSVAIEIDTASANSSADVMLRIDGTNSVITTSLFDPGYNGDVFTDGAPADGTRTFGIRAANTDAGSGFPTALYKMRGYYTQSGTAAVTNGSPTVNFSQSQTLSQGQPIYFASQPGVAYTISASISNATTATLTANYTGTTNPSTTAVALETWTAAVPNNSPPSGHSLTNIVVIPLQNS